MIENLQNKHKQAKGANIVLIVLTLKAGGRKIP